MCPTVDSVCLPAQFGFIKPTDEKEEALQKEEPLHKEESGGATADSQARPEGEAAAKAAGQGSAAQPAPRGGRHDRPKKHNIHFSDSI